MSAGNRGEWVPEGWKLVPVVPTVEMRKAAELAFLEGRSIYRAMLSASPAPPPSTGSPTLHRTNDGCDGVEEDSIWRAHCEARLREEKNKVRRWALTCLRDSVDDALDVARGAEPGTSRGLVDAAPQPSASSAPEAGKIDEAMVERALAAEAAYWADDSHATKCKPCNGTGVVSIGDEGQDLCHLCGGNGMFHDGTEEGAMRAALEAAGPEAFASSRKPSEAESASYAGGQRVAQPEPAAFALEWPDDVKRGSLATEHTYRTLRMAEEVAKDSGKPRPNIVPLYRYPAGAAP